MPVEVLPHVMGRTTHVHFGGRLFFAYTARRPFCRSNILGVCPSTINVDMNVYVGMILVHYKF